jgi:transcriptional regulator with XRE-family HTH domain
MKVIKVKGTKDEILVKRIGERIFHLRKEKKFNSVELAAKANINPASLSNIENGKRSTSVVMLNQICNAMGITLKQFFYDESFNSKI